MKTLLNILEENHRTLETKIGSVPFTIERTSDNYGTYTLVLVAITVNVNQGIFLSKELSDNLNVVTQTTNTIQDFSVELKKGLGSIIDNLGGAVLGTYIPLDLFNENWKKENPNCKYLEQCPKQRKLPVIEKTEKQMIKFLETNNELINTLIEKI